MQQWLMKVEIEGELGVAPDAESLVYQHPRGDYVVHLQNLDMTPGCETPLLTAHFVYPAVSLEDAELVGDRHARSFGDFLAFTTGARFRVREPLFVYDWTPGTASREGVVFHTASDPDLPQTVMTAEHATSLESLLAGDSDSELARALHWFALGVGAEAPDEQFQLFWFAVEIMARRSKPVGKVPDACPKCRQPLFCTNCNDTPTHRPYQKQSIEALFTRHVSDTPDLAFKSASSMRHALMHADDVARIEAETGFSLGKLVDVVGGVAWAALLTDLRASVITPPEWGQPCLIQPSTFRHRGVRVHARVAFGVPEGRDPEFSDVPEVNLGLTVSEAPYMPEDA